MGFEVTGFRSQRHDPAAELQKLGGAKVILSTVTNRDALSAVQGGLGLQPLKGLSFRLDSDVRVMVDHLPRDVTGDAALIRTRRSESMPANPEHH